VYIMEWDEFLTYWRNVVFSYKRVVISGKNRKKALHNLIGLAHASDCRIVKYSFGWNKFSLHDLLSRRLEVIVRFDSEAKWNKFFGALYHQHVGYVDIYEVNHYEPPMKMPKCVENEFLKLC
jgi:hypothetical protein